MQRRLPMPAISFTTAARAHAQAAALRFAVPNPATASVGNTAWLSFARHLR